jgi:hypothetical protein
MPGILPDNDVGGAFLTLTRIWFSDDWRSVWDELKVPLESFDSLKLERNASDLTVWKQCQKHDVILVTGNRNADGPESLEMTFRSHNDAGCLPVFTLANPRRVLENRDYAERVAEQILERLIDIELYRGAGRLFIP